MLRNLYRAVDWRVLEGLSGKAKIGARHGAADSRPGHCDPRLQGEGLGRGQLPRDAQFPAQRCDHDFAAVARFLMQG
jgi:hypothetical protein